MQKSHLKRFATQMRVELMGIVESKLEYLLGLNTQLLPVKYRAYREHLQMLHQKSSNKEAKESLIEEVAYTWFNRLIALRFMDANGITETPIISPSQEGGQPDIFMRAKEGNIDPALPLDKEAFYALIDGKHTATDPENEAYSMLFVASCNAYAAIMPTMFEAIADYTELLLPDDLLSSRSVRAKVVEAMPKSDCEDVEIIGWLYQFYIAEKKDAVFAKLKKNIKITPANIPAATQLFTPHWIVKYMVENSLGRLWLRNYPSSSLKSHMRYYIDQEDDTPALKINSPQELSLFDPCCGSGHVLTYAFDLLTKIYEEQGYATSEIPSLILENNLFGCDIDKRAASLAYFALMMKARLYHRRFFRKNTKPKIIELQEFGSDVFKDIKNIGSLLKPADDIGFDIGIFGQISEEFTMQQQMLQGPYTCVVTNPPYMGGKGMNKALSEFVKSRYPDSKSDLFAVFMERGLELTCKDGYMAMITMQSWMFLSSYEKLREKLLKNYTITTMAHLDNMVMGIAFGTAATVFKKTKPTPQSQAVYFKINLDDLDDNREIKALR